MGVLPNKQLTTGEGGAITTDDPDLARELRSLVNQGRSDNGDWLVHQRVGFNYRMDEMSAAVGLGQLEKLDMLMQGRRRVAERYDALLAGIDGVELPYRGPEPRSWFIYYVRLAAGIDRAAVSAALAERGIATRPYLPAIHTQPTYASASATAGHAAGDRAGSKSTLALPFFVQLEEDDIAYVASSLREVLAQLDRRRSTDGVPGLRQIRARRPDLCDGADRGRRPRRRPPHAGVGRRDGRAADRLAHRAHDPGRHGQATALAQAVRRSRQNQMSLDV